MGTPTIGDFEVEEGGRECRNSILSLHVKTLTLIPSCVIYSMFSVIMETRKSFVSLVKTNLFSPFRRIFTLNMSQTSLLLLDLFPSVYTFLRTRPNKNHLYIQEVTLIKEVEKGLKTKDDSDDNLGYPSP